MVISKDFLGKSRESFIGNFNKQLQNTVVKNGIDNSIINYDNQLFDNHIYSVNIHTGKVANQKQSGRCWIFAALNTLRHKMNKKYNLENFELSQTYIFFYDKLEKSNYFLNSIIKTKNLPLTDRTVHHLLAVPQQDGGQWDMVVSLIQKYGVVPKSNMPDTFTSTSSHKFNELLNLKLRKNAKILREANEEDIPKLLEEMLSEIYTFLCINLGTPPEKFDFEVLDKNKKNILDYNLTPLEFYNKYIGVNLDDYISLINAPTNDKPYYKTFTVDFLGNVIGGKEVKYLNVPMEVLKEATVKQLQDGETVWFGCDVGQYSNRKLGILDDKTIDFDSGFNIEFAMDKKDTLDYLDSLMTHAMVISGVNIKDNKVTKWKVENTWGEEVGEKGYFVMSDSWMDRFTYQVVVNKKYLSQELQELINQTPIFLKPWDPMGSLAITK